MIQSFTCLFVLLTSYNAVFLARTDYIHIFHCRLPWSVELLLVVTALGVSIFSLAALLIRGNAEMHTFMQTRPLPFAFSMAALDSPPTASHQNMIQLFAHLNDRWSMYNLSYWNRMLEKQPFYSCQSN